MITLGIDYGASNIGIALVDNTPDGNRPLFAGTVRIDARWLKDKVETRAGIRRLRRTKKTKKHRLQKLLHALLSLGIEKQVAESIVHFSERRGYKSLFDEGVEEPSEKESELTYRFSREEFFSALEGELLRLILEDSKRKQALTVCSRILNRRGDPLQEVRLIRIDNRGASRCAWEGCTSVTPRRDNAIREALSQQVYTVFQEAIRSGGPSLINAVEQSLTELADLGKRIRGASGEGAALEKKVLRKKARAVLLKLKPLSVFDASEEEKKDAWKYIQGGLMNLIEKRSGRNRYCREHTKTYIDTVLASKPAPFKKTISEADIISRREQIVYAKLWRYLEARLLPLSQGVVDRIVVERTAFDLLAGSWKKIASASPRAVEEMYQHGPRHGFANVSDMLREEFGGLCAYCGRPSDTLLETEHILPRADFFFDSYLNLVPSCPKCNKDKADRPPSGALMRISDSAYQAFSDYLAKRSRTRPLHLFHTIKKGLLNLMRQPDRVWEAERYLTLVANQFAQIVQTQRSPRPFARYLATKLSRRGNGLPDIQFKSGRHTAVYRQVAYPDFNKYEEKAEGNAINHALDALLLASNLPSISALEARNLTPSAVRRWTETVKRNAPPADASGVPSIQKHDFFVEGFETIYEHGYVEIDLRAMNWNQKDSMTHKQDPYGWSDKLHMPTKRKAAAELYDEWSKLKNNSEVRSNIERVYHPALRSRLETSLNENNPGKGAAEALRAWLRESVTKSLAGSRFSEHPADKARREQLAKFAESADSPIPPVIGVKMIDIGVRGMIDLERRDRQTGGIGHRYMTQPSNRAVIIAYPKTKDGDADLSKPHILQVRQNQSLKPESLRAFKPLPTTLSRGNVFGEKRPKAKRGSWYGDLEAYLSDCGFSRYATLTPGCVVCYQDGTCWFVRNFDQNETFRKTKLRNIVGVRRNPFSQRVLPLSVLT